jgi:hypothetical protein
MDTGDFTGDDTHPGRLQTDALIEGMNALGYRVSNLGTRELLHGWEAFRERQSRAKFEFVSANIVWQDTGDPVVAPATVLTLPLRAGARAKEVRVGFLGLAKNDPAFHKESAAGRRIVTVDPLAAAEQHLPALRREADIVVAVVALDLEQARALPKRVREIDLVLGGLGGRQTRTDDFPEDTRIGRARIFAIGDQGKNVGEVRLVMSAERAIASNQRHVISLGREWPDEPALARLMDTTRVAINEYHKAQAEPPSPFAPAAAAVAPPAVLASDPAPAAAAGGDQPAYTGSGRCAACHEEAHGVWARSGHAHAFDTLVRASQDYNPKCVGCHTVGFGRQGGFVNVRATPGLTHVQCESCHGPSSLHPDTVLEGYGRTDLDFCRTCHTGENSPDYDPPEYVPKVRHWVDRAGR